MNIPTNITAGFTLEWNEAPAGYPSDQYTLHATFILVSNASESATVTATADGTGYRFTVPAATTAGWSAGQYRVFIYAVQGANKYEVGRGYVTVAPDPFTSTGDTRDHIRKMLDAIEATLEGRAGQEYASMTIDGYSVTQMSPDELLKLRAYYRNELRKAENLDRIASGKSPKNKVLIKFT